MWTPKQKVRVPLVYCAASHILGFAPSSYVYKMLWLMLSQAQSSCYRGLREPSSLWGKTLGTRATEHEGSNWGMKVD